MGETKKNNGPNDQGRKRLSPSLYIAVSLAAVIIVLGFLWIFVFNAGDAPPRVTDDRTGVKTGTEAILCQSAQLYRQASRLSKEGKCDQALELLSREQIEKEIQEIRACCWRLKARLLRDKKSFTGALDAYNEALSIYRKLAETKPAAYLTHLADTLFNKGILYSENPAYQSTSFAGEIFAEALNIYEKLAKTRPDAYKPQISNLHYQLGVYYRKRKNYAEAARAYENALAINKTLASQRPDRYLARVADTLNAMAFLDHKTGHRVDALAKFKNALDIYRELKKSNPDDDGCDFHMSRVLANLGNMYREDNDRLDDALAVYEEALTLRERLEKKNPGVFIWREGVGNILIAMSCAYYLQLANNPTLDEETKKSYKLKGLLLVNRAIDLFEKYREIEGVAVKLEQANKVKAFLEN
jgi:tetratricopeptide (TPR) repeat protein